MCVSKCMKDFSLNSSVEKHNKWSFYNVKKTLKGMWIRKIMIRMEMTNVKCKFGISIITIVTKWIIKNRKMHLRGLIT